MPTPASTPGAPPPPQESGPGASTASIARFAAVTLISLVALFYLLRQPFVVEHVVEPYTAFVAAVSRGCLRLVGIDAGGEGGLIVSPEFAVSIKNVCNGLEVTAIFFAVTLGFPAPWRARLLGLAMGYPAIFAVNIARIMVLFLLGFKVPNIFDAAHYYYAQAIVIIVTVAIWLLWVSRYSGYGTTTRPRISD